MAERKQLADEIFDINMKMFLRDNFVHGDLHSGNLLYDAPSGVLTVLDAGLTTSLPESEKAQFVRFLKAMTKGRTEAAAIADSLISFHDTSVGASKCCVQDDDDQSAAAAELSAAAVMQQRAAFADEIAHVFSFYEQISGSSSIGDIMGSITQKLSKYGICLRGEVSTCIMTISVSEGLLKQLDPSFNIVSRSLKYLFHTGPSLRVLFGVHGKANEERSLARLGDKSEYGSASP